MDTHPQIFYTTMTVTVVAISEDRKYATFAIQKEFMGIVSEQRGSAKITENFQLEVGETFECPSARIEHVEYTKNGETKTMSVFRF